MTLDLVNPPGATRDPIRRVVGGLLLGYAAFIVYGSLVPLNFHALPWAEASQRFLQLGFPTAEQLSRVDVAVNVLLTLPLAFLLREWLPAAAGVPARLLSAVLMWLGCGLFSMGVEFTQVYFPGRTVSLSDIAAQTVGSAIGLMLHMRSGPAARRWFGAWWGDESGMPLARHLLRGYLAAMLLFAVMPLDLTLSPVEIFHKFAAGHIFVLPFSDLRVGWAEALYETATDVVIWLPVGFLWRLNGLDRRRIMVRGLLAALAIEIAQLFVMSRVTSTTDVLTGALGCVLGGQLPIHAFAAATPPVANTAPRMVDKRIALFIALFVGWALLTLLLFWYPFDVRADGVWLRQRLHDAWRPPFAALYQGSEFHALNEMLRKALVFLPAGLLWAGVLYRGSLLRPGRPAWHGRLWRWAGVGLIAALAALVELGQLFLVDKVSDMTDFTIESLGGWSGLWLGLRLGRRKATTGAMSATDAVTWTRTTDLAATPTGSARTSTPPAEGADRTASAVLQAPYVIAVVAMLVYVLVAGWRVAETRPADHLEAWPVLWAVIGSALVFAVRRPWLGVAAFFCCQFVTPRYGPVMELLLALQALPAMAVLAAWAVWIRRRKQARRTVLNLPSDGLFALFFAWVAALTWLNWGSDGHRAIEPLYHPVNYLCAALFYWIARNDLSAASDKRRLAAAILASVLVAAFIQISGNTFYLNGHMGFLMALGLPLVHGLAGSAAQRLERAAWWSVGLVLALLIVLNQNRSAIFAMLAFASLTAPRPRRATAALAALLGAAGLLTALWSQGYLDRFMSIVDPSLAVRIDVQAQQTVQSRLVLWRSSWELIKANPMAGVGPGQFEHALARFAPGTENVPAHNTWLTLLSETGAVGAGLAVMAFLTALLAHAPRPACADHPRFGVERTAKIGLVVCVVFGLFNSRADFVWAYFMAGWAVPLLWRETLDPARPSARGSRPRSTVHL